MLEHTLWYEKYAPKTLDQCFLSEQTRQQLQGYVDKRDLPNMIFSGTKGIGKSTVARVLIELIDAEWIKINGSLNGGIDVLRTNITQFVSTISMNGEKKYVWLDEADNLTQAMQMGMRGFIDEFSRNCGFILTCNYKERILEPISDSRLTEISFNIPNEQKTAIAKQVFLRLVHILQAEKVEYDPVDLKNFLVTHMSRSTDIRKLLINLQKQSQTGHFLPNHALEFSETRYEELTDAIGAKNFLRVRQWVGSNSDIDQQNVFRWLYDNYNMYNGDLAAVIVFVAEYQYKHNFVADKEINLTACIVEIMQALA